ncbi:MAG: SUMF1/EgtB/PvdO family nonheme iron enzyme [Verrucomicrobiales bacterium]|nr:SUMF1/EgtB/PvdO family nonheme iron enzyme [Verrucomicrobiales bacterium]MCP5527105.1 SUMF1/EgtB/PvdO family nonheme iron enzyme [Verrucomicrobiales bacterium]
MSNLPALTERIDKGAAGGHEFERLLNQLLILFANAEDFDYEPTGGAGGDDGLDGLARQGGVPGFEGPVGFQFKWLWDGIHKGNKAAQITDSLKRAATKFDFLRHWILITPHDLTPKEREWLLAQSPRAELAVHHWGQARIESLLRECAPKLFARYYPHEAAAAGLGGPRAISTGPGGFAIGSVETLKLIQQWTVFLSPPPPDQPDPKALLWNYLNQVIRDTAFLDLSGIDRKAATDNEETRLQLAAVYTELDTLGREMPDPARRAGRSPEMLAERDTRESVTAFASRSPCAVLLGDPGSGKTTFANFLALALAGELLGNETANLKLLGESWQVGPLLPLRIVLRDFAAQVEGNSGDRAGAQLFQHFVRRLGSGLAHFEPLLRKHLVEQGGLLILDGLDEVPEARHRREFVKQAVLDLQHDFPKLRFLLTSRTYAYQRQEWRLPGFTEAVIAPFSDEQVRTFVSHWYDHVRTVRRKFTKEEAQGRAALLQQAIAQGATLRELARRPLLLTLMASLHAWRGGALPDQREELYEESVNLLLDFWEKPKVVVGPDGRPVLQTESAAEWFSAPRPRIQQAIEEVAFRAHRDQPERTGAADIPQADLVDALMKAADADLKPGRVVEYVRDRAGLLLHRAEGVYSLPHRTFQEYLAARHLTQAQFPDQLVKLAQGDIERWREVVLLAGAKAARGAHHSAWSLVAALCPDECETERIPQAADRDWWLAMLAGQVLNETGIARTGELSRVNEVCLGHVRAWLTELVDGGHLPPVDRAAAGAVLGRLGDFRKGVGLTDDGLPDIDWIEIPEGSFTMGSTKDVVPGWKETPQFECRLLTRSYRIARYPVTVAQYQAFVDAGGYAQEKWWSVARAAGYWEDGRVKGRGWTGSEWKHEIRRGPGNSGEVFRSRNAPVVDVNWFEAVAFCAWLSERLGSSVALPSEAEWERAARHTDGRVYPWGNAGDDLPQRCNMSDTGIGHPSAVGMFPTGEAECGARDMVGNVWEWCRTKWRDDYRDYEKQVDDRLEGNTRPLLRGGSWLSVRDLARCACRGWNVPNFRDRYIGFRLVASPFSEL